MNNTKIQNLTNEELIESYQKAKEFLSFLEKEKENIEKEEANA